MRQKLDEGDTETALALAKKAFALRPTTQRVLRDALRPAVAAGGLVRRARDAERLDARPAAATRRRDPARRGAVARRRARGAGRGRHRRAATRRRCRRTGSRRRWCPAAALAARVHARAGRQAQGDQGARPPPGAANPHPELAAAFAAIEPDETPAARRKRFETLIAADPNHAESRLLAAELALAAEDFPGARKALGDLAETEPTDPQPRDHGRDRARPGRAGGGGARLARQGARRVARAAVDLRASATTCTPPGRRSARTAAPSTRSTGGPRRTTRTPGLAQSAMLPLIIGTRDEPPAPLTSTSPPPRREPRRRRGRRSCQRRRPGRRRRRRQ